MQILKIKFLLGLLLLPWLGFCAPEAENAANLSPNEEFDYFVFVRQWAGSFCHTSSSCPLVHRHGFRFTIHGLWPNYDDGTWPEFCDRSDPFDEDKLKDIMEELEEEWPSFMKENDGFWSHEWDRHGTCAAKVLHDEHEYFKAVLKLQHDYDLADALVHHGIKACDSHKYKVSEIEDAIRDYYKVDALVHCDSKGELSEVWMCIGKDMKPFDCKSQHERCDEVLIPTLGGDKRQGHQSGHSGLFSAAAHSLSLPHSHHAGHDSHRSFHSRPFIKRHGLAIGLAVTISTVLLVLLVHFYKNSNKGAVCSRCPFAALGSHCPWMKKMCCHKPVTDEGQGAEENLLNKDPEAAVAAAAIPK